MELAIKDDKIFIYLRLRDDKETLLKSRIREFAALGKLLADFMRDILERFGLQILKVGSLEYVDANTDLVLISFKKDVVRQQIVISGIIPHNYQNRMLNEEEVRIKLSIDAFVEKISPNLDPLHKAIIHQRIQRPTNNVLALIKHNINHNGEFYIVLDTKHRM